MRILDVKEIESKISLARSIIKEWAIKYDFVNECGTKTWIEHYKDEPGDDTAHLLFWIEGILCQMFDDEDKECEELSESLKAINCYYEREENTLLSLWFIDADGYPLPEFKGYFEWKWICELLTPDYSDMYEEIYQRFYQKPSELYNLHHRDFEKFLRGLFENLGYRAELGPGTGDGGVDLRLFNSDVFGEVLTVVQVKKYHPKRPITLEAVQALTGVAHEENAENALFITTSNYLPGVKRFASSAKKKVLLKDSNDIQLWCADANNKILKRKAELISNRNIELLFSSRKESGLVGKIFHAAKRFYINDNRYAILLVETKGAALMLELMKSTHDKDGYGQVGTHTPDQHETLKVIDSEKKVFRVRKIFDDKGNFSYLWGDRELWSLWDNKPNYFNYMD